MSTLCHWCASGKPLWHQGPFKARYCVRCATKPDVVDGVKLKTPQELAAERKQGRRIDRGRLKAALDGQRLHAKSFPVRGGLPT